MSTKRKSSKPPRKPQEDSKKSPSRKKGPRIRFTERYFMYFSTAHETGIVDLSNWEGSAVYNTDKKDFDLGNEWIYNMRDGDGDCFYIYNRKLTEEMCDLIFDQRPRWF